MADENTALLDALKELAVRYGAARGYTLVKRIGFGGSAAVFQMQSGEADIALKVYAPSFFEGDGGPAERRRIELQKKLIGHGCGSLVGILKIEYGESTCFIEMPYVPWNDLSKEIAHVPRENIYGLLGQLVVAVRFLENEGLVHRDIKPANILVSGDHTKLILIDLGVVREWTKDEDQADGTDHGGRRPFIATNQYSSPEYLFRTQAPSAELWKALTWYQIGGVLHDLIARKPLFLEQVETGNRYAVALAVQQITPNFDAIADVPLHLKGLALRCLTKDPRKRLKLVNWGDFSIPSSDPAQLATRLGNLSVMQSHQHAIQQEKLQAAVLQAQIFNDLMAMLESLLKNAFSDALLEVIRPSGVATKSVLRWHFSSLSWVMDTSIEIVWAEDDGIGNQPEVRLTARLSAKADVPTFSEGDLICVVSSSSQNLDSTAQCIFDTICSRLGEALGHLEQGEPQETIKLGA